MRISFAQLVIENPILIHVVDIFVYGAAVYLLMYLLSEAIARGIAVGLGRSRQAEEQLYKQRVIESLNIGTSGGSECPEPENPKKCSTMGFIADIDAPH